jgi:hypothetical protein
VRQFEIVGLVEERSRNKGKLLLKRTNGNVKVQNKKRKKGRAAGGIIAGVKLGIKEKRRRMYGKKRTYRQ